MKEVELNLNNYSKCLCTVCPVQAKSECVAAKREKWLEVRRSLGRVLRQYPDHPEAYEMDMGELAESETGKDQDFRKPAAEEMIELYCCKTVGKSNCVDLDGEKSCQCPTCAVWTSHDLKGFYYCAKGSPE